MKYFIRSKYLCNYIFYTLVIFLVATPGELLASKPPANLPESITTCPVYSATATPSSQTLCPGTAPTVVLSTNPLESGTTFSWPAPTYTSSVSGGTAQSGVADMSSQTGLTNSGSSNGTATYVITPIESGCTGTPVTVTITVYPNPVATATPSSQSVCPGTAPTVTLATNPVVSGTKFSWPAPTYTGSVSGGTAQSGVANMSSQTGLTNSGALSGTATYIITPTANGCTGTSVTVTITVYPNPVAKANPLSQSVCQGTAPTVTLATNPVVSGTTFSWPAPTYTGSVSGGTMQSGVTNMSSQTGLTNSGGSTGTATYIITPTANGCPGTPVTVTISVYPNPVAKANPLSQSVCQGTAPTVTLSTNPVVSGTTFSWPAPTYTGSVSGGTTQSGVTDMSSQTGLTNSSGSTGSATYIITPTANGCTGTSVTVTITVYPNPVAKATPSSQSVCPGTAPSVTLSTNPVVSGTTFSWPAPTYTGSVSGGTAQSGVTNMSSQTSLSNSGSSTGTATYIITPTANGCAGTPVTVTISVYPAPVATATPSSQSVCPGTAPSVTLSTNPVVSGTTFSWPVPTYTGSVSGGTAQSGVTDMSSQTGLINNGGSSGTAKYIITPTTTTGCPGTPVTVTITVYPTPTATATPSSQSVCPGTAPSVTLSTNPIVSGTTFSWPAPTYTGFVSGGTAQSGVTNMSSQTGLTNSGGSSGTATYVITPIANGCTGTSITVTITVYPTPVATANPSSQTVCPGTAPTLTLSTNPIVSGTTFSWIAPTYTGFVSGGTAQNGVTNMSSQTGLTNNGGSSGTAKYVITPTANGCAGTPVTVTITVYPGPIATATPSSQTVCPGTAPTVTLSTNPLVSGTTFSWSAPTYTGSVSGGTAQSDVTDMSSQTGLTNNGGSSGTAKYVITPTANGCTGNPVTVTITVYPTPVATATPSFQSVCPGTAPTVILSTNPLVSGTTFSWTAPTYTGSVSGGTAQNGVTDMSSQTGLTNNDGSSGTATYTITPTANGCTGIPVTVTITVYPTPVATATPSSQSVCPGIAPTVILSTNPVVTGTTFSWSAPTYTGSVSGGTAQSDVADMSSQTGLTNTGNSPGTAMYSITPTANGCAGIPISVTITVYPNPGVSVTPPTQTICSGSATNIKLNSRFGSTFFGWRVIQSSGISNASPDSGTDIIQQTIINTGESSGTVTYTVRGTDSYGCIDSAVAIDTINPNPIITDSINTQSICSGTFINVVNWKTNDNSIYITNHWEVVNPNDSLKGYNSGGKSDSIPSAFITNTDTEYHELIYFDTAFFTNNNKQCASTNIGRDTVTVYPKPWRPLFTHPDTVCAGENGVQVSAYYPASRGAVTYYWSSTPALTIYDTTSPDCYINLPDEVDKSFTINLHVITAFGCDSSFQITINTNNNKIPVVHITDESGLLICSDTTSITYQWGYDLGYVQDSIPGANNQWYQLPSDSTGKFYWVITTYGDKCTTKTYYEIPTGINNTPPTSLNSLLIFPNPNGGNFRVQIPEPSDGQLVIVNIYGQKVLEQYMGNKNTMDVNVHLPSGLYLIMYNDKKGKIESEAKIIIQN